MLNREFAGILRFWWKSLHALRKNLSCHYSAESKSKVQDDDLPGDAQRRQGRLLLQAAAIRSNALRSQLPELNL